MRVSNGHSRSSEEGCKYTARPPLDESDAVWRCGSIGKVWVQEGVGRIDLIAGLSGEWWNAVCEGGRRATLLDRNLFEERFVQRVRIEEVREEVLISVGYPLREEGEEEEEKL